MNRITVSDLKQTGARAQRWLSLPESRIVLNPLRFEATPGQSTHPMTADRNTMPLNIGYLDPTVTNGTGRWLTDFLTFYEKSRGERKLRTLWEADHAAWSRDQAIEMTVGDEVLIRVRDDAPVPWQFTAQRLEFDLSDCPVLTVHVKNTTGHWALKLCRDGCVDVNIQGDTNSSGIFTFPLDKFEFTDADGHFSGLLKIFAIGKGKSVTFSECKLISAENAPNPASAYGIYWYPHTITAEADYPLGLSLGFADVFADTETVVREVTAESEGEMCSIIRLCGNVMNKSARSITMSLGQYTCCAAWSKDADVTFFPDLISALGGRDSNSSPDGCTCAVLDFGSLEAWESVTFAVSIGSDSSTARKKAADNAQPGKAAEFTEKQAAYWNNYLEKVPHPEKFTLDTLDPKGITPEYTRQMYYIGWIFLAQNVLPPNPEIGFNYRQVACGKPSMWAYGDEKAVYTASWESFFGMMSLGHVMPDTAWDAYTGLMSLVDEEGMLAGESLPSEKAHTAYRLWRLTGDTARLEAVYDSIARYLRWRVENPRWIYLEHNNPDSADSDFAESALLDIDYMIRISEILGKDPAEWKKMYADFMAKYKFWFFEDGRAYQYTSKSKLTRSPGNTVWVTKGLGIPGLEDEYIQILYSRFLEEYDPEKSFCGMKLSKFPDNSHTIYGLRMHGYTDEAEKMNESCIRDVLRVGMFAEGYTVHDDPLPEGVRPSIFGCMMLLDGVLMKNGFRLL